MISRISIVLMLLVASIQTVNASDFGRTVGKFAVSAIGTAQYSIPIWTPPGPNGIRPNLALQYDSQGGIGPLGVGWSLAGLGQITRCNKTIAQDNTPAAVSLTSGDAYCINGNRLRGTSGAYGTAGSTYQTETADFSNVTANGTAGNGPAYFTVQGRDGNTYQYGYTDSNGNGANSQALANGSSTVLTWFLSKIIDRAGNNLVVNYLPQAGPSPPPPTVALSGTTVPASIFWTPISAGASTYAYKILFNYVPNAPQSSFFGYVAGSAVSNAELLSSIEIFSGSTVVKDYFLGYQASPLSGRKELNSVKECADSAASNCLLPTSINYQGGVPGVSTVSNPALSSALNGGGYADFNGDGIADLVYNDGTSWFVAFGSPSGYGTPLNTGIAVGPGLALFGNVSAGHEDGILKVVGSTWWYYQWNGIGFVGTSTGLAFDTTASYMQLADMDGDGRPDLITENDTTDPVTGNLTINLKARLNTSTGGGISFSTTSTTVYTQTGIHINGGQLMLPGGKLRRYDFNGDGRDDLVLEVVKGVSPNFTINSYELISTGTAYTATLIASGPGSTFTSVFFTDWNNDKCTDFVTSNTLYVSACNGTVAQTFPISGSILTALDWDGDGRTDLLVANGSTIGVYLSNGSGAPTLTTTTFLYNSSCIYSWLDANGDGLDDLGCESKTSPFPVSYFLHNGTSDLAISFVDGYGVTYSPSYVPLSASGGTYTKGTSAVFPHQDYIGPSYVVASYTSSDGIGGIFTTTYNYAGAILNLQGRGFQGFTSMSSTDSRTGFKDTRTYSTGTLNAGIDIPTAGMLLGESVTQSAGTNVSVGTYTLAWLTLDSTANNERYFPYTASSSVDSFEVQIPNGIPGPYNGLKITTTAMNYGKPDNYGNFSSVSRTVTDEDPGTIYPGQQWTISTATSFGVSLPGAWCNSLPTERDVTYTSTGLTAITRHTTFVSPDYTNCRQTEQVVESGSAYQVDTKYGYDPSFGTLTSLIVTGASMPARTTTTVWGTTGQFPISTTNPMYPAGNPLAQTTHFNFDPVTGKLFSVQDPNGITTSWLYDSFGRMIKETRPDQTYTVFSYNDCVGLGGCLYGPHALAISHYNYTTTGIDQSDGTNYLDQFDRPVITNAMNMAGTYDRSDARYDNLGNISQQSMPCAYSGVLTPCTYWNTFTHDPLNRLTKSQRPISASDSNLHTTTIQYSGRTTTTTTTDPQAIVTTTITKVNGTVGRTIDNNGYYINFNHDAFGSILSVTDSLSNTLRSMAPYAYGIAAFKTSMTDMDLGSRTYAHNALGELTSYTDGKGQSFSTTYDALSRPLVRAEPDLTTSWTWGSTAASFNIGKLQSIVSTNTTDGTYSETYAFDSASRPTTTNIAIPNVAGTFIYTKAYNASTGLIDTLQYPLSTSSYSLKLQYGYSHGILQSVSDFNAPTTVFWTANSVNPRGQITQEALGNGVVTARSYDAVTGWLNSIQAGVGSGAGIQNNAYLYDEMGNVTQRQDNNQRLTENFFYDNLSRLDHSTLGAAVNLQMHYDAMGNITSRSDVAAGATWTYDPVHKHQVTQAGNSSFAYTYDANGNMSSRLVTHPITWTSANYPIRVDGPGESSVWTYGPNREVYKSYQQGPGGDESTYHYGRLFELVTFGGNTINFRHYIMAGNELVAVYSRTFLGVNTLNYIQSDHQGSIASITTSSPATDYVNESFTAFGDRRNGETWSGAPLTGDETLINAKSRWGYTGHTAIGVNMGLVHMNGRIEDTVLGRFLSPDPRGTIPGNTQSWNRYSYVNNNPLSRTDPTGFEQKVCASVGTCPLPDPLFACFGPGCAGVTGPAFGGVDTGYSSSNGQPGGIEGAAARLAAGVNPNAFSDPNGFNSWNPYGINSPIDTTSLGCCSDIVGDEARGEGIAGQFAIDNPLVIPSLIAGNFVAGGLVGLSAAASEGLAAAGSGGALVPMADAAYNYGSIQTIAGYQVAGTAGLVGDTYAMNVWGLYATEGAEGIGALANGIQAQASFLGAADISITGNAIINPGILNIGSVAARYGFSYSQINATSIWLWMSLVQ
jgi:RHS repeat-associated protein